MSAVCAEFCQNTVLVIGNSAAEIPSDIPRQDTKRVTMQRIEIMRVLVFMFFPPSN